MHFAKYDVPRYLNEKHRRKEARFRQRQDTVDRRAAEALSRKIEAFGRRSKINKMIASLALMELATKGSALRVRMPAKFSIIENPVGVVQLMAAFAATQRAKRLSSFFIDFRDVKTHDLGAHTLLDVVVDEIAAEARLHKKRLRWRGTYPKDESIRRLMKSLGIIRQLKVEHEYPDEDEAAHLRVFSRRCKHYIRQLRPEKIDEKGLVAAAFADHMNACLAKVGKQLKIEARALLCSYLGEVIENAEVHAGMVDWMVHGYLDASLAVPLCEIVILNFGRSFAQSLEDLEQNSFTRMQIQPFLDVHSKQNWFSQTWRREDLLTLVALQGNVSSRNTDEDSTRGQGTADLIEFFQRVHDECKVGDATARMTIVSGGTRLYFDGTYRMKQNASGTRIIAFNASNDLNEKPDPSFVMPLRGAYLPGTAICIQFPLASTSLGDLKEVPDAGQTHG